ncbi:hypothetical protein FA13DRAFT_233494 [Coprinellus micaceus]|uniref:RNI-like protein n=1 Tax=Coprinellus micaceus TaxID=71717 RepID=A0A4Y7TG91_COPMI|nr:hypothetical protein FA13DRAFT_233494 [Coprinellus micaceus]
MYAGWLPYTLGSSGRPSTLFPSLKRIFLSTPTALALYVANNSAHSVKFMEMALSGKTAMEIRENGRALTSGLHQDARALTNLRITNPLGGEILRNIAQITSLESLQICVSSKSSVEALHLDRLGQLAFLRRLCIKQNLDPKDREIAATSPNKPFDARRIEPLSFKVPRLQELRVVANGTAQFCIATALVPENLEILTLSIPPDALNTQMVLIPNVMAMYAKGNPSLASFTVEAIHKGQDVRVVPEALEPFR